jgi:DtxR family transcriptional regulator, Mn-dependent transcriptional regulator
MAQQHAEEYLGAIFRLRKEPEDPLPLPRLQTYFGYSPISIHEMVQKLEEQGYIIYIPYRGVVLSQAGEQVAAALIRRHRIWERFLTDMLAIPADSVHQVAGELEHAAPELVTERLSLLLGQPEACPHGSLIPAAKVMHGREIGE